MLDVRSNLGPSEREVLPIIVQLNNTRWQNVRARIVFVPRSSRFRYFEVRIGGKLSDSLEAYMRG